ncbi:hypothetical protein FGO68_gene4424 [Halteria grandinella]|uniref:Tr-type G domain-containing protein n=1 Tax=Halteria grandinella TaxID=5974 RepID=A0A8J8NVG1_HALGN|nr:hypothetical protein FGO68_gene4424 [Halteria grandinella]
MELASEQQIREQWLKLTSSVSGQLKKGSNKRLNDEEFTTFLACCSEDSYDLDGKAFLNHFPGTKAIAYQTSSILSIQYGVYQFRGKTVIAFRGTEGVMDIFKDVGIFLPSSLLQRAILDAIKGTQKHEATVVTGHSLGGFLAECVSSFLGLTGASFNAPAPNGVLIKYAYGTACCYVNFEVHLSIGDIVSETYIRDVWTHIKYPIWHYLGKSHSITVMRQFFESSLQALKHGEVKSFGEIAKAKEIAKAQEIVQTEKVQMACSIKQGPSEDKYIVEEKEDEESDDEDDVDLSQRLNVVFLGHTYSGKSTLIGNLLYSCKNISQRQFEKEYDGQFAYIVDKLAEERHWKSTIAVSKATLLTQAGSFNLINVPGHKKYLKNTMTGASNCDIGILVVSAALGEYETSISNDDGMIKKHLLLAFTLGVKQMIVCINKIDIADFSEKRFNLISVKVEKFMKKIGFNVSQVNFIPISSYFGDNLVQKSSRVPWYRGPTLLHALIKAQRPKRRTDLQLRIPIQGVYKIAGVGIVAQGRIETGTLKKWAVVKIAPANIITECKSIEMDNSRIEEAHAGDCIGFVLKCIGKNDIWRGCVVSDAKNDPAEETESFLGQIIIIGHPGKIKNGYTPIIDCHTAHVACEFKKIESIVDKKTGKVITEQPESVKNGDQCIVRMVPKKPLCVEPFKLYPPLGRFVVRDMNLIIAVGIVKEVTTKIQKSSAR